MHSWLQKRNAHPTSVDETSQFTSQAVLLQFTEKSFYTVVGSVQPSYLRLGTWTGICRAAGNDPKIIPAMDCVIFVSQQQPILTVLYVQLIGDVMRCHESSIESFCLGPVLAQGGQPVLDSGSHTNPWN